LKEKYFGTSRVFSEYFGFPLSITPHQYATVIFIIMLPLSAGQVGEDYERSKKAMLFLIFGSI
jgi:hypothetical protein